MTRATLSLLTAAALAKAWTYVEQNPDPSHLNRIGWMRASLALAEAQADSEAAARLRKDLGPAAPASR